MAGTQAQEAKKTSVKYTGPSIHTRILSKADFKKAGLEVEKDLVFDETNDHTVDASNLSPEVVDFILKQPDFKSA